jgi:hypothetical protein
VTGLSVGDDITVCIGLTLNTTKSCSSEAASVNIKLGHSFIHPVLRFTDVAAFKAGAPEKYFPLY